MRHKKVLLAAARSARAKEAAAFREARQADGTVLAVDPSKCFYPPACPGCSNCDRMVTSK